MPIYAPTGFTGPLLLGPSVQLPAGDWSIAFDLAIPAFVLTSGWTGTAVFSLSQAASVCADPNTLTFAMHDSQSIGNGQFSKTITLTGVDGAGNRIGTLNADGHMGETGTIRMLTVGDGTMMDNVTRTWFLVMRSGRFYVYCAAPGQDVYEASRSRKSLVWTGFSEAVPLNILGALRANGTSSALVGRRLQISRFLYTPSALSMDQMRRFANGAPPSSLLTLAAPSLYWPMANTAALGNGAILTDTVQGATLTNQQTGWQVPFSANPTAEADCTLRVSGPWSANVYKPSAAEGGFIGVDGSFSTPTPGRTINVQLRAVQTASPYEPIDEWQTVATNITGGSTSVGTWSGRYNVNRTQLWKRWQVRAVIDGVEQPEVLVRSTWGVGYRFCAIGQSIMKIGLATDGIGQNQNNFHSVLMPFPGSTTDGDQNFRSGMGTGFRGVSGAGMNRLAGAVADTLGCHILTTCPAKSGASIGAYVAAGSEYMDWALHSANYIKADVVLWNQGNSTEPSTGKSYYEDLEDLYTQLVAGISHEFVFAVMPVGNEFNSAQSSNTLTQTRRQQIQWVRDKQAQGRKVVFAGSIMDLDLVDTTHPRNSPAGNARISGRIAQTLVNIFDPLQPSGVGPTITACIWDGANSIKVKVRHNGGTALKPVQNFNNTNLTTYPSGVGPSVEGSALTGWTVGQNLTRSSGGNGSFQNPITVTSAVISGPDEITLTLGSVPTKAPYVAYLEGKPGFSAGTGIDSITNLVYDNRAALVTPTLGYPLEPTAEPVRCTPQQSTVTGTSTSVAPGEVPVPLVGGWGVHPQGELVTPLR